MRRGKKVFRKGGDNYRKAKKLYDLKLILSRDGFSLGLMSLALGVNDPAQLRAMERNRVVVPDSVMSHAANLAWCAGQDLWRLDLVRTRPLKARQKLWATPQ